MSRHLYLPKALLSLFAAGMMLLSAIRADAQNWALPSSRWQYTTTDISVSSPSYPRFSHESVIIGDTVLAGVACRKVSMRWEIYYTYDSAGWAFIYLDGAFRRSWNFNALPGDTLMIYRDTSTYHGVFPQGLGAYHRGVVDSVVPTALGTDTLRLFYLTVEDSFNNRYTRVGNMTYAERIGLYSFSRRPFYPVFMDQSDAGATYSVCNYGDSTLSTFWLYPDRSCRTVGIQDLAFSSSHLHCYPSPSSGAFTIDLPMSGSKTVHIYEAIGRSVFERSSEAMSETVYLSAAGVYLVIVETGGKRYRGRVVVE